MAEIELSVLSRQVSFKADTRPSHLAAGDSGMANPKKCRRCDGKVAVYHSRRTHQTQETIPFSLDVTDY